MEEPYSIGFVSSRVQDEYQVIRSMDSQRTFETERCGTGLEDIKSVFILSDARLLFLMESLAERYSYTF